MPYPLRHNAMQSESTEPAGCNARHINAVIAHKQPYPAWYIRTLRALQEELYHLRPTSLLTTPLDQAFREGLRIDGQLILLLRFLCRHRSVVRALAAVDLFTALATHPYSQEKAKRT